jgi:ectoine hydroxylase-related dioxygenase (phytanoyl-CoA dioxygenase family)
MLKKQIISLKKNGFVLVKKCLSNKEVTLFKNLCKKFYNNHYLLKTSKPRLSSHSLNDPKEDMIIYNLQNKDYKFIKLGSNPKILSIVQNYFNYGAINNNEHVIFHQLTARSPISFGKNQILHIDSRLPGSRFPIKVVVTVMLDDFTIQNGATRLIPGSHLYNRFPNSKDELNKKIKYIKGKKGDVLILDGGIWHAGSKNSTKNTRWSILITYDRWYIKQAFDLPKSIPPKILKKCNNEQKNLLGINCVPPLDEFDRINAIKY